MKEKRKEFEEKIRVMDLKCAQGIPKEEIRRKRLSAERAFDLGKLPTNGLREEFRAFLFHRGEVLSLSSIRGEFWPFNILCQFLQEKYPDLESFLEEEPETMERALKGWMIKQGYSLSYRHSEKALGKERRGRPDVLSYLSKLYQFLQPQSQGEEIQRDVWRLEKLPFPVKQNPSRPWLTLNFQGILQEGMRKEVKKACAVNLRYAAVTSVGAQIQAAKRFAAFLLKEFPGCSTFCQVGREELEQYLVYLHTEDLGKKSFRSELYHLKSLFYTIGQIYECPTLRRLFLWEDIPKRRRRGTYQVFSENELKRLNGGILALDEQVARALILHQMLGNRISETLTLKQDCVVKRGGYMQVRIFQPKTQSVCYKPASQEVVQLIGKSIAYTNERYGKRPYVFVQEANPDQPMHYGRIQHQLMVMIREKDLRDDQGELFRVATHRFRHNLGKALTEMHVDDATIARMLGHSNTDSVQFYRQFGNQALAEETRPSRETMDALLEEVMGEWE